MSEALERVIAEQQAHIDHMKTVITNQQRDLNTVFTRHEELFEAWAALLGAQLPKCSPDPKDDVFKAYNNQRWKVRVLMTEAGFCMSCHRFICECEADYE